jgi:hypothetical protein
MPNAAAELADLLANWNTSANHPVAARGGTGGGDTAFWQSQRRAVELLGEIDRALDALRDSGRSVASLSASVPDWYRAVFSFHTPWGTQSNAAAIDENALNALKSCALVMDMMGDAPVLSESQRALVVEQIGVLNALLAGEVGGLSAHEREYVFALSAAIEKVVSHSGIIDAAELKTLIDQLNGSLVGLAAKLNEAGEAEASNRLLNVVRNLVGATRTIVYDAAALSAIITAIPVVQKMIEG